MHAFDHKLGIDVAIKIIKEGCSSIGLNEIQKLQVLNDADPDDTKSIIRLIDHFRSRGNLFIVLEKLYTDLFNFFV